MPLPSFVGGTLDFEITDEVVHVVIDGHHVSAMSLRKAEAATYRLNKLIADYKAKRAEVVAIRRDSLESAD